MKDFHQLLLNRRSIRKYTNQELNADDVKLILEAALVSPSSKSTMGWEFIVVEEKEDLERLSYCKEHGIRVKVRIYTAITPKNFHRYRKKGYISVLARNYKIVDDNGKVDASTGGHYMTITDVTEDKKRYVVSSWGKRYYLDPKDVKGYLGYQMVRYKI